MSSIIVEDLIVKCVSDGRKIKHLTKADDAIVELDILDDVPI